MKSDELQALGLSEEQTKSIMALNGRDIERHKATARDLEAERDDLRTRLGTAEEAIKRFDGVDPEKLRGEVERYKKQAEEAERTFAAKLTARDQRDWLERKLTEYGVKSPYARRELISEAMASGSGLSWKDGSFYGIDEFMTAAKKADPDLYETAEERAAREAAAAKAQEEKRGGSPRIVGRTGSDKKDEPRKPYVPPILF